MKENKKGFKSNLIQLLSLLFSVTFQLEILEAKLQAEIGSLHDRIEKIQSEIAIYENLDALKDEAEQKRVELLSKKNIYLEVQDKLKDELKIVRQKYEEIKVIYWLNISHPM